MPSISKTFFLILLATLLTIKKNAFSAANCPSSFEHNIKAVLAEKKFNKQGFYSNHEMTRSPLSPLRLIFNEFYQRQEKTDPHAVKQKKSQDPIEQLKSLAQGQLPESKANNDFESILFLHPQSAHGLRERIQAYLNLHETITENKSLQKKFKDDVLLPELLRLKN